MSQSSEPAAPQSEVVNSGNTNQPPHLEAYTDPALTTRNATPATAVPDPVPAPSGSTTTGEVTVYDPPDIDHTPINAAAVAKPHAPNSWKPGRDPYKVDGMVGQDFFKRTGA
jgi:hypothetical protein